MKNRSKQRLNRKIKEQMLDLKNTCGINDPTPYEAVKKMIEEVRQSNGRKNIVRN